jgi:hypothetical protein
MACARCKNGQHLEHQADLAFLSIRQPVRRRRKSFVFGHSRNDWRPTAISRPRQFEIAISEFKAPESRQNRDFRQESTSLLVCFSYLTIRAVDSRSSSGSRKCRERMRTF